MELVNECAEREYIGGGRHRLTQYLRPIAYPDASGNLRPIVSDFVAGDASFPSVVSAARLRLRVAGDHTLRILPVPTDDAAYTEISSPYIRLAGGGWTQPALGTLSRAVNCVTATTTNVITQIYHGGHFVKPAWLLRNGWRPLQRGFAFKVGLSGLTRDGDVFSYKGVPVMHVQMPIAYDYDNPAQQWPIEWKFTQLNGDWYILFTLPAATDAVARLMVDPTVTLQPGAADGVDTLCSSSNPTFNYGTLNRLITNTDNASLIKFDLSAIPASALCTSATITFYQMSSGAASAFTITAYSIAAANAAWIEGTQAGALALAGEPCWNARAANGAGGVTTAWAGSAGLGTSDVDYEASALGMAGGNRSDANGTAYAMALTTTRVRGWFGGGSNYGLKLVVSAAPGGIGSGDNATAAWRPKLDVTYTLSRSAIRHGGRWI